MIIQEAKFISTLEMEPMVDIVNFYTELRKQGKTGTEAFIYEQKYQNRFKNKVLNHLAEGKDIKSYFETL